MKTDVDTCLIELADWYVNHRHEMTGAVLQSILMRHCGSEAEVKKFTDFLLTKPGQLRFKTHLKERKEAKPSTLQEKPASVQLWDRQMQSNLGTFKTAEEAEKYAEEHLVSNWRQWIEIRPIAPKAEAKPSTLKEPVTPEVSRLPRCFHRDCKEPVADVLRDHKNIYSWFCKEHFVVYRKLPAWTFNWEESQLHKRWLESQKAAIPKAEAVKSLLVEDECQIVSPANYDLIKWVGIPVPDYSLQLEPEAKERKIDEVLAKLRAGVDSLQTSDQFRQYLLTMSKFHDYSIGNLILIMMQRRDATHVAGFVKWKELGRYVKSGERGIAILAPCLPPKQVRVGEELYRCKKCGRAFPASKMAEVWTDGLSRRCPYCQGETELAEEAGLQPLSFKVAHVFDISQTEGKPLPEFEVPVLTGAANEELFSKLIALTKTQGLEVGFESKPEQSPEIKGMYSGKSIWVRPEEARAQQLKTLVHEIAHYFSEGVFHIPRADAEVIAESSAFVVGAHFGFDTGTRSFPYIALWSKDKKVLEANLSAIRKVSERMITGLEV